ncbi:MAG: hypothetical protein L0211_24100 [Planctomycetaceae bacterium]|nr:hypothetical protein [Planctomycetaceae bacterium]
MPSSAVRRAARRQFFTPLRLEWLERRDCPTGSVSVFSTGSVNEGSQASFNIQGSSLPAGGVTAYYQTVPGSATEGSDYTGLSGSVFLSPTSPMVSVNVSTIADGVYDSGETFSLQLTGVTGDATIGTGSAGMTINETGMPPPGPNPQYIMLASPGTLNEGQSFTLTGVVSPAASYHLVGSINWGGFATHTGTGVNLWTSSDGSFSIGNYYFDDGASPGNGTASDVATIVLNVSTNGTQLSAQTTATVHNVAPAGFNLDLGVYTPLGGPNFFVTGALSDPGTADVHTVTIDWGDGSEDDIFTQLQYATFMRIHTYPPSGLTYPVTVTIEDDDLGVFTWSDAAPMYLLDLDNDADNNGEINEADDPIEAAFPGAYVGVNGDDDNLNEIVDMALNEVTPVENENDLEAFRLRWTPAERPEVDNYAQWFVGLFLAPAYTDSMTPGTFHPTGAAIYGQDNKNNPIPFVQTPIGPAAIWSAASSLDLTLYLEARAAGQITMELHLLNPSLYPIPSSDLVVFTALAYKPEVQLTIFDGQNATKAVPEVDEDITGAVTVANLNDTDADEISDWEDHTGGAAGGNGVEETRTGANRHGRDEVDLMKLIVHKPIPYTEGAVTLTVTQGAARVRLWGDSKKKTEIDAAYDPETGIATWAQWGGGGNRTIWVEITNPSSSVADIELKLEYAEFDPDIVKATGVWATLTASQFSTKTWDELAGTVWRDDMDAELQDWVSRDFGGTGLRPILYATGMGMTWARVANVTLLQFTVTPTDVASTLARVEFDLARSRRSRGWGQTTTDAMPVLEEDIPWEVLWEKPNDDPDNDDESDKVNDSDRMYVIDGPGAL